MRTNQARPLMIRANAERINRNENRALAIRPEPAEIVPVTSASVAVIAINEKTKIHPSICQVSQRNCV